MKLYPKPLLKPKSARRFLSRNRWKAIAGVESRAWKKYWLTCCKVAGIRPIRKDTRYAYE